ncbi:MAG TPA: competence/damage-inducible protein A, partial [Actinomycetota bacterium]|nr:competence/damage-inducible protein A [Actinomycetota bacterium]
GRRSVAKEPSVRCEIIGVGTELLLGQIVNTNAAWIGQRLADVGWDCLRHTVVGDNSERIAETIAEALGRADAVILTGGLGPTQDDVTREALAAVAGVPLVRQPELEQWLRERFARMGVQRMAEMNLRQADVPEGARVIDNPRGTAPGLIVEVGGKPAYAVPGVPREMEGMLERVVLPDLAARAGEGRAIVSRTLRTAGVGESRLAERLTPLWEEAGAGRVTLAYLASPGEVRVRLTAVGPTRDEALAEIAPVEARVREELGDIVYGADDETLEAAVGRLLRERGRSLATAESLTGGLLGGRITGVPGASDYYLGGVVAYATDAKASQLGVAPGLLAADGPVSEPVAAAMAEGARVAFGADLGLAATGVAGPTEQSGRRVGTLCLGVADAAGAATRTLTAPGDRTQVRLWTSAVALDLLRRRLEGLA